MTNLLTLSPRGNQTLPPSRLANLALWLKADDATGITESGGAVSAWKDRSLTGHDANQANTAQRPAILANQRAGKPGVYFDVNASNRDSLIITATDRIQNLWREGGYAAFVMENRGAPQGAGGFGVLLSSSAWFLSISDYSAGNAKLAFHQYCSGNDNQWRTTSTVIADNTPYLIEFIFNGSVINRQPKIFINGVLQTLTQTATASGNPDNDLGNNIGLMGWYNNDQLNNMEAILYEAVVTRTIPNLHERKGLRRYLAARWNLSVAEETYQPVYLLAGQSNMVGLGTISAASGTYTGTQSNVKIWNGSSFASLAAGTNNEGASGTEFGPELSFGYHTARDLAKTIYLVKYAVSGKSLAVDFLPPSGTNYVALKTKLSAALANLAGQNPLIMGICWMQGESDADSSAEAAAYEKNLAALIEDLRITYAEHMDHDAPFIIGEIANVDSGTFPYTATVQAAQAWIGSHRRGAVSFATSDLALLGDNVHFNTDSQITLGQRFASALLAYAYPNPYAFDARRHVGLRFWLDGADSSAFTKDVDSKVSRVWDKSGCGMLLKNSGSATTQPLLSGGALVFDGSDDYLQESAFSLRLISMTHFMVMRLLSNGNYDVYWSWQNIASSSSELRSYGTTGRPDLVVEATGIGTLSSNRIDEDILVVTRIDGTLNVADTWINGVESISGSYTGDIPASDIYTLAARSTPSDYGNLRVYENLIYNQALSTAEINETAAWLAQKWGLNWTALA